MNKANILWKTSLTAVLFAISACGGGSGGGEKATVQPTKATVKISTAGTLSPDTKIGGIDVTVALAQGVSLKSTLNPPEVDSGVVVASGAVASDSMVFATYAAETGTTRAQGRVLLANPDGFATGEFVTLNCDIAAGSNPSANDFSLTALAITDVNGVPITGLTLGYSADIE